MPSAQNQERHLLKLVHWVVRIAAIHFVSLDHFVPRGEVAKISTPRARTANITTQVASRVEEVGPIVVMDGNLLCGCRSSLSPKLSRGEKARHYWVGSNERSYI